MIHHMSFGVREPKRVANVLAELLEATAIQAPTPPFPHHAWLVVFGDDHGSFLEVLPSTTVFDPDAPLGLRQRPATSEPVTAHVLVSTSAQREVIEAIAAREGWRTQEVETGLFRIVKLWIEGNVLVEFLAHGEAARYQEAFGTEGLASLNGKLRALEARMAGALAQSVPPEVLAAALGQPG